MATPLQCICFICTHIGHREGTPRGIPNDLHRQDDRARKIGPALLPAPSSAVTSYESGGGHITTPRPHGFDPLADDDLKKEYERASFPSEVLI